MKLKKNGLNQFEAMKILRRTKNKITKDKNGKRPPHLEINEVVIVHCNVVNNSYQRRSRVLYTFVRDKSFGKLLDILSKSFIFEKLLIQSLHILKYVLLIKIVNR